MNLAADRAYPCFSTNRSRFSIVFFLAILIAMGWIMQEDLDAFPLEEKSSHSAGSSLHGKPWQERKDTLVIGRVSGNPQKHYKRLKPIVDYVVRRLQGTGIVAGDILLARNNQQMIQFLKEGKVDWMSETLFSAVLFHEEAGAEIVLRRQKGGVQSYCSLIFVREDSGLNSLEDLRGRRIAFNDAGSTTSFLLPVAILKSQGIGLVPLASRNDSIPKNQLGYIFTGGDELNVSTWVYKGFVDAGAVSNLDWESPRDTPEVLKKKLKVIYQTQMVPRALELFRSGLPQKVKEKVKEILLNAHKDLEGQNALKAYSKTRMFDEIDRTLENELSEIRKLYPLLHLELKSAN